MLDPYYRIPLEKVGNTAVYKTSFQCPDKHGIFQFKVNYKKPGYTFLNIADKVTVRPYNHNEFERYIP